MAELKAKRTAASVAAFLARIPDEETCRNCRAVAKLMQQVTKARPRMWGTSIAGFGSDRYKYDSGREGEWFLTGLAPRKQDLTLYLMGGIERYPELQAKLGKHKHGKSCVYVKRLADLNLAVLRRLVTVSVRDMKRLDRARRT